MRLAKPFTGARMSGEPSSRGFIALVAVMVAGAVGAAIATVLLLQSIGYTQTALVAMQSYEAKALADACMEDALEQIHDQVSFAGVRSLALGQGTCSATVIGTGGQGRIATASATVGTVVRKVKVVINKITPAMDIASWAEVADF